MPARSMLFPFIALGGLLIANQPSACAATVQLELVMQRGFSPASARPWAMLLADLGYSGVPMRPAADGDQFIIEPRGEGERVSYKVVGQLTSGNQLRLPGAPPFSLRDKAQISAWFEKLKAGGLEGLGDKPGAFGLSGRDLVEVHKTLATKVDFATKGMKLAEVLTKIGALTSVKINIDPAAQAAIDKAEPIADELQPLSIGTAIAAAIRPAGLVMVPKKETGTALSLQITTFDKAHEAWPVGWPTEKTIVDVAPDMMKYLGVEIVARPLSEPLDLIQTRTKTPLLLDHNGMARRSIDPTTVKVSIPNGRTFYKKLLDRLLFQAKLQAEIRVDEAGQGLLWISPIGG